MMLLAPGGTGQSARIFALHEHGRDLDECRVLRGRGQGLLHEGELEYPVLAQDVGLGLLTGRDLG
jgi:hypothetical protein